MNQAREQIAMILRTVTVLLTDMSSYHEFNHYVENQLANRIVPGPDVEQFAVALVFEAALRSGPEGLNSAQGKAYPLKAAKHLLALGEYPEDVRAQMPEIGMSLWLS